MYSEGSDDSEVTFPGPERTFVGQLRKTDLSVGPLRRDLAQIPRYNILHIEIPRLTYWVRTKQVIQGKWARNKQIS